MNQLSNIGMAYLRISKRKFKGKKDERQRNRNRTAGCRAAFFYMRKKVFHFHGSFSEEEKKYSIFMVVFKGRYSKNKVESQKKYSIFVHNKITQNAVNKEIQERRFIEYIYSYLYTHIYIYMIKHKKMRTLIQLYSHYNI